MCQQRLSSLHQRAMVENLKGHIDWLWTRGNLIFSPFYVNSSLKTLHTLTGLLIKAVGPLGATLPALLALIVSMRLSVPLYMQI